MGDEETETTTNDCITEERERSSEGERECKIKGLGSYGKYGASK